MPMPDNMMEYQQELLDEIANLKRQVDMLAESLKYAVEKIRRIEDDAEYARLSALEDEGYWLEEDPHIRSAEWLTQLNERR